VNSRQYAPVHLKRLLLAVPTLIGVSMLVFFMRRVLPGDIVSRWQAKR
jgi:ABC-type dipeptide/oligopeptide/nickel transport system permease component